MISTILTALVLTAIAGRLVYALPVMPRSLVMALVFVVSALPFPWGAAGWVQSFTSEFSVTSALLALAAILHRVRGKVLLPESSLRTACWLVAGLSLLFYPLSLGVSLLDPYALGYGDFRFSTALLLIGMLAWVLRAWAICAVLVCAQLAYAADLLRSDNVWNYLLDPFLVMWVYGWLVRDLLRSRRRQVTEEGVQETA